MDVADPFIERHGVNPLGNDHPLLGSDRGLQNWTQGTRLGRAQLAERLAVPASLYDQLSGIGEWTGVVADEPEAIIEDDPSWGD